MRGLGIEIAKNLVLMGVSSLTIQDFGNVELSDLSSQVSFSYYKLYMFHILIILFSFLSLKKV